MMEIVINNKNIIGGICCDEEVPKSVPLYTLLKYNGPEWIFLTAGIICCCCTGTIMPVFAFFYGEMFSVSFKNIYTSICPKVEINLLCYKSPTPA